MPALKDPERLDRFELIAELASGGMATVYLARLGGVGGFQRLLAIKRLHPHLAHDAEFIQMFLDEARLAARIHHPNVVPIQEVGTSERGYYLVMDYIEGDTEARLFARSAQAGAKIAPNVGIRIALDVLAGLHASHELRDVDGRPLEIVHRDVSPQNILVGVDGISRITDFGVARAASRLSNTRSGQLKGKLAYMAPEQARSKAFVDRRADVFAMGIVLWETLAFRRLFKGDSEAETLNRVLYEPIPRLQSAAPTVPASLDAIVMKALDRDPEKRFQTAAELGDALEKAAHALHLGGTQRDVAACVQQIVGTEIEAQREVVRAWLARSEPSQQDSRGKMPVARAAQSVTRVERAGGSITPPPGVSSVSSSGLHVTGESPSSGGVLAADVTRAEARGEAGGDPARRRRTWTWSAALGVASLVAAWGIVLWRSEPPRAASKLVAAAATAAPPPPAVPSVPSSPALVPVDPAPLLTTSGVSAQVLVRDSGPDGASEPKGAALSSHTHHPHGSTPTVATAERAPPASPPAVATAAPSEPTEPDVPDDITRNPYR